MLGSRMLRLVNTTMSSDDSPSTPGKQAARLPARAAGPASTLSAELRMILAGIDSDNGRALRRRPLSSAQRFGNWAGACGSECHASGWVSGRRRPTARIRLRRSFTRTGADLSH